MEKDMKTLEEHNKEKMESFFRITGQLKNGIACPKCGKEMFDTSPGVLLATYPPKKNIHCENCGYKDYAIV